MNTHRISISESIELQSKPLLLFKDGKVMEQIQPKVLRFLEILVKNKNQLVTHDTFIEALWDGNYLVGRQGIIRTVNKLRRIIEDDQANPSVIISYYGQGYLLASYKYLPKKKPENTSLVKSLASIILSRLSPNQ